MFKATAPCFLTVTKEIRLEWQSKAIQALYRHFRSCRKPKTIEQARVAVSARLPEPGDLRWWGNVTKALKRSGLIRKVSHAPTKSSHYSHKPTWIASRGAA